MVGGRAVGGLEKVTLLPPFTFTGASLLIGGGPGGGGGRDGGALLDRFISGEGFLKEASKRRAKLASLNFGGDFTAAAVAAAADSGEFMTSAIGLGEIGDLLATGKMSLVR